MRARLLVVVGGSLLAAGCGGGGGGGSGGTKRTVVFPHALEVSGRCVRVAVGDVDGDGLMDMCVHEEDTASVEVLLSTRVRESPTLQSKGQTSFRESPSLPGRPPRFARGADAYETHQHVFVWDSTADLCLGDLDRDGRPDLVVAGGSAMRVGICPGDPTSPGRFSPMVTIDCPAHCDRVAVGDVNGDGRPDLVCLDETSGRLMLLLQNSAPLSFTVDTSPPTVGACFGLVLADLDGDGKLDCVTNRPDADVVTLWTWTTGVLAPRDVATGQATGRCMAVGDVDGDGRLDVCVLGEGGTDLVCLHQRTSQPGTFDPEVSPLGIAVDEQGVHVCVPAVQRRRGVVSGCGGGNACVVDDAGQEVAGIAIKEQGVRIAAMCVTQPGLCLGDFDGDGALDLCAMTPGQDDVVFAYGLREPPTRRFEAAQRSGFASPTLGRMCACADLDQDGRMDCVTCDATGHLVNPLYTDHDGIGANPIFENRPLDTTRSLRQVAAADLDGDGRADLVAATDSGLEVRFADPASPSGFKQPVTVSGGSSFLSVAVGDLNGDGKPDLVACSPAIILVLTQDSAAPGGFALLGTLPSPTGTFRFATVGDMDADGHLDVVCIRESPTRASVGRNTGGGTFAPLVDFDCAVDAVRCCVADGDGDGDLDAFFCSPGGCTVVRQIAPFLWDKPELLGLMTGIWIAAGDVNGDGLCDVCASGAGGCECAVQFRESPTLPSRFLPAAALSTEACGGLSLGDFDGDGRVDCCFVLCASGECVCVPADPDAGSAPTVRLNGLPPGEPVIGTLCASGDLDGDGDVDLLLSAPQLGSVGSTFAVWPHMHQTATH